MKNFINLSLVLLMISCGQKSQIKNAPESVGVVQREVIGSMKVSPSGGVRKTVDENYLVRQYSLPIVPSPFEAVLPNLGAVTPIVGGLAKLFMSAGLVSGKKVFTLNQPIPEIPSEFIRHVSLKRIFFVIEEEDLSFIKRLAIVVKPKRIQNELKLLTSSPVDQRDLNKAERRNFDMIFDKTNVLTQQEELNPLKMTLKYDKSQREEYTDTKNLKNTFVIETGNPGELINHILYNLDYYNRGYLRHFEILENSLLIELSQEADLPVASIRAQFESDMRVLSTQPDFAFHKMTACKPETCLDMKIPQRMGKNGKLEDINLMSLLTKENSIEMEAYVDVGEAPSAFKVKGYIQAEIKIYSPIK